MDRREMLLGMSGLAAITLIDVRLGQAQKTADFGGRSFAETIRGIERRTGGRLGLAVLDTHSGRRFAHRGDERFALCSTFKFLLSGAVLHAADSGRLKMSRTLTVRRADILGNSPVTERNVGRAMTLAELCHATMTTSDNAAANLLLPVIGGPAGLTRFVRALGDEVTRIDRYEPILNEAISGDPRDTTSPLAMLHSLRALTLGRVLTPASRRTLTGWMLASRTGATRLRAGVPRGWRVADKTGTGQRGSNNDIGLLLPNGRPPILVTSYLSGSTASSDALAATHAAVARAIASAVSESAIAA
ncbi:class A beta-lactamase [Sphingomonas cannabina]|uniref:class A beta-lactamase n=1 Tax=Sphingomonas cannabina TaxID=2899123 RepID=UPI001EFF2759|nr:class A beta-lactamase [Sphingomonas cannabina]UIJ46152.1 class A beta-lactamase [Sphingomonas cannabina]